MAERAEKWGGGAEGRANPLTGRLKTANGAVDVDDGSAQALFEFDPVTQELSWSDTRAAGRVLGDWVSDARINLAQYDARVLDGGASERVAAFRRETQTYACQYRIATGVDGGLWVEERGGWISLGGRERLIGVIRSVQQERTRAEHLARLANFDDLTNVLNRPHLRDALVDVMSVQRAAGGEGAYILAGIDDLGGINADFGFEVADGVIREVARRLSNVIGEDDAIGRVAGTKFGIVIAEADEARVREICVRLMNSVRESVIDTEKGAVAASICLGSVSLPDEDGANAAMGRAEAALDQAKRMGRSSWSVFNEKTDVISTRRRNTHMSDVILTALNERRVRLAFQPIVTDMGEAASKFECLIRMQNDEGRDVPAPEFIPVAERLGLVHLLDRRVLELAINTLAVTPNVKLNVNVSMETVKDPVWAEGYLSLLRAHEPLSRRITVELTETQVIDAIEASIEFVSEIKRVGASFAIDDFGAGYTSFRNLKALDIDILKIDGSFVTGVASSRENQLFVRTLLDLARNFGMKTVAEWVDNEADAMLLKGLGVDYLQGFLIGRPETNPTWLPGGAPNEPPGNLLRA